MDDSLMSRYVENDFKPVEVEGDLVYPEYTARVAVGDRIRLSWISAASPRVQGITLRLRISDRPGRKGEGGLLRIEGEDAPVMILWMDSAPLVVEAECVELKDGALLRVSNRWRLPDGREDEWLNNYGMKVVEIAPNVVELHCNDGYGDDLSFSDLVVRLEVVRSQAA